MFSFPLITLWRKCDMHSWLQKSVHMENPKINVYVSYFSREIIHWKFWAILIFFSILEHLTVDSRLPTIFRMVWVCLVEFGPLFRLAHVVGKELELCKQGNHFVSKVICYCGGYFSLVRSNCVSFKHFVGSF